MNAETETLARLARESGKILGELGVLPGDDRWIREHAATIASLTRRTRRTVPTRIAAYLRRLARNAARKAR